MVFCENCGNESYRRKKCPCCERMVCNTCRYFLGMHNEKDPIDFCDHGIIPFWKTISLNEVTEDILKCRRRQMWEMW